MTMNIDREFFRSTETSTVVQTDKSILVFHLPKTLVEIKKKVFESLTNDAIVEHQNIVSPFLELKIKNSAAVYAVAKSYLEDIKLGKKNFGFTTINDYVDGMTLLGIGSCISYLADNLPILIVVEDLKAPVWDKYRKQFTPGSLGRWKTYDWGHICLLDYTEILSKNFDAPQVDLKVIESEFRSILWGLPPVKKCNNLSQLYISVFKSLNSIAIINKKFPVDYKEINEIEKFYKSIHVPLKGILNGGDKS